MTNPSDATPAPDESMDPQRDESSFEVDEVQRLLEHCLELPESQWPEAIESLCRDHSHLADEIRQRVRFLQILNLGQGDRERQPEFPERLGDFQLDQRIGAGGMGVVYVAHQGSLNRDVALKMIRPDLLYFPGARQRFRREVEAISRLHHPGIVPVHLVGEEKGIPYFAMELLIGCTLADVLKDLAGMNPTSLSGEVLSQSIARCTTKLTGQYVAPMTNALCEQTWVGCCLSIAQRIAETLDYAHREGVLHRDIKPSNIFLTTDGRVMLLDFGLASTQNVSRITKTGSQIGSLPYMSPEQVRGESELDVKTDVYSLAVTLYELLTLQLPYAGRNIERTRQLILNGGPRPIREVNRRVPWDVETICLTAMERDPRLRYDSAGALAQDVDNVFQLRSIEAKRPGPVRRVVRLIQRRPTISVAIGLGGVLLVMAPWISSRWIQAEKEAATHAKSVLEISDFMVQSFLEADPYKNNPNITVREALDRAIPQLNDPDRDLPERAYLYGAIGRVYLNLGYADRAEPLLQQGYELYNERFGYPNLLSGEIMTDLAQCSVGRAEFDEALRRVDLAIEIGEAGPLATVERRKVLYWDSGNRLLRGDILFKLGKFHEAEESLLAALELAQQMDPPSHLLGNVLTLLGTVTLDQGRYDEARNYLRQSIASHQSVSKEGGLHEVRSRSRYATLLSHERHLEQAAAEFDAALEMARDVLGEGNAHPILAELLFNYGAMRYQAHDSEHAARLLQKSYELYLAASAPAVILEKVRGFYTSALCDVGRFVEAEPLARQTIESSRGIGLNGIFGYSQLGRILLAEGNIRGGRDMLAKAREIAGTQLGELDEYWHLHFELGKLQFAQGEIEQACKSFRLCVELGEEGPYPSSVLAAMAAAEMGRCFWELAQPESAEPLLVESHATLSQELGPDAPQVLQLLENLVEFFEDQDQLEKAERYEELLWESS